MIELVPIGKVVPGSCEYVIVAVELPVTCAAKVTIWPQVPGALLVVILAGHAIIGAALTVAVVVPTAEVQPLTVTVTLYVPEAAVVAFAIEGFCSEDVKPLGPVQL